MNSIAQGPPSPQSGGENEAANLVLDVAVRIHSELGPGLLESVYEIVLSHELTRSGLFVQRQLPVPIKYGQIRFDEGFRADLVVNRCLLVEIKSLETLARVHAKQTLTYLRLSGLKLGLLINFGEASLKNGIKRIVNGLLDKPSASSVADLADSARNPGT